MLAELALAAVIFFPWSLLLVPLGIKLLRRWRCWLCMGSGSLMKMDDGDDPCVLDSCSGCNGWGYTWRKQ